MSRISDDDALYRLICYSSLMNQHPKKPFFERAAKMNEKRLAELAACDKHIRTVRPTFIRHYLDPLPDRYAKVEPKIRNRRRCLRLR